MLRKITIVVTILAACLASAQTCSSNNLLNVFPPWDPFGAQGHKTGGHYYYTNSASTCTYTSIGQQYCASVCSAYGSASGDDTGQVTPPLYAHTLGAIVNGGTSTANGAQIQCGATAAVTAVSCLSAQAARFQLVLVVE
jgi:hypothetical protein